MTIFNIFLYHLDNKEPWENDTGSKLIENANKPPIIQAYFKLFDVNRTFIPNIQVLLFKIIVLTIININNYNTVECLYYRRIYNIMLLLYIWHFDTTCVVVGPPVRSTCPSACRADSLARPISPKCAVRYK